MRMRGPSQHQDVENRRGGGNADVFSVKYRRGRREEGRWTDGSPFWENKERRERKVAGSSNDKGKKRKEAGKIIKMRDRPKHRRLLVTR